MVKVQFFDVYADVFWSVDTFEEENYVALFRFYLSIVKMGSLLLWSFHKKLVFTQESDAIKREIPSIPSHSWFF